MRHPVSIFCTKWSDEECACTGGYWGLDHPESNMNPNGYNLSISVSINDIWCFLYFPANVGYLLVFETVHQDNTQWLILKAQELWPQHQQQVRDWQRSCQVIEITINNLTWTVGFYVHQYVYIYIRNFIYPLPIIDWCLERLASDI